MEEIKSFNVSKNHTYEKTWIKFVALALFCMGVLNIFSAWLSFNPSRINLLRELMNYEIIIGSRYLVLITGVISLIVAPALYRYKRFAWYVSVVILGVSGFAHVLKGADVEEAGLCLVLFGILLPLFKHCNVKSDPIRLIRSRQIILAALIFVILYTALGIHIFSKKLGVDVSDASIWPTILGAMFFDTSNLMPVGRRANFFVDSLFVVNSLAYLTGLIYALSPVIAKSLPESDLEKYKQITKDNASQVVQFFTLTNDYQHFSHKNPDLEGFISCKVIDRVALAIGNPCTQGNLKDIIEDWLEITYEYDWIPAVYQAQGEFVELMKKAGFNAVPIGVEAVVNLKTFTLSGKQMQNLRTGRNKAIKEGWRVKEYTRSDWNAIKALDAKWLSKHGNKENSFAMGKSSKEYLEITKTRLLFDANEELLGYINLIDLPTTHTRAVDIMRRDPTAPQGTMEYLFLHEILASQEEGLAYFDLGFSPLAKVDESFSDNKAVTSLFKLIFDKQKKYYDFQGLHTFKSKFNPEWQQSYLLYTNMIQLPKVLMALIEVNKGS